MSQVKILKWEAPPPPRGAGGRPTTGAAEYARVAAKLTERPGEWALILSAGLGQRRNAQQFATRINSGSIAGFVSDEGKFEATSRDGAVYARFMPVESS